MAAPRQFDDSLFCIDDNNSIHWPLFVSSSGGGGHIAAIQAIKQFLVNLYLQKKLFFAAEKLPPYKPVLPEEKPRINSQKTQIAFALDLPRKFKDALDLVGFPVLPDSKEVKDEIARLANLNSEDRFYIDLLLDVYPSGYENVAIWNLLQKHDKTDELKKLIDLHKYSDQNNYKIVKDYFIKRLEKAAKNMQPYTEVISTQAMALPALCDAVIYYNEKIAKKYNAMPIMIHQYMTDLPTPGAVHFFKPLERLSEKQRSQMILYGVDLESAINFHLPGFAKLISLDSKKNPMVRSGFYDEALKNINLHENMVLHAQVFKEQDRQYKIVEEDKVASIMLGSQASLDTIEYVRKLVESGIYSKIFVFGGNTPHIQEGLSKINCHGDIQIIPLDNQDDKHIAPIMTRSNLVIIRGGGLSVMEQMALPHPPDQVILIHSKKDDIGRLTSGISWEDSNVDELEAKLYELGIQVRRTTVEIILDQLKQMESNVNSQLEDDANRTKTFLKDKLVHLISDLEKVTTNSEAKKSIVENFSAQLQKIVQLIDDENIDPPNVVLEVAKYVRHAEECQKAYQSRFFNFKSFFKHDSLVDILKDTKAFIKKYFPTTYRKEKEIFQALGNTSIFLKKTPLQ